MTKDFLKEVFINKKQLLKMLEEMQENDEDLEKELDRSLEIFKQM